MSEYLSQLNMVQARILACLMEKQLTTPDQYPLTKNALQSACNQKTNRNPVMDLKEGELGHTLMELSQEKWVDIEMGSRAERYQQKVAFKLKLTPEEQAILCMLMLRGPQTLNELSARTERMIKGGEDALLEALDNLLHREAPLIEQLDRQSGQREDRYSQLLFDQGDIEKVASKSTKVVEIHHPDEDRIAVLEKEVALLKEQLENISSRLDGLE